MQGKEDAPAGVSGSGVGSLAGRRAIVTGAARGIGRAIAERLHRAGAALALCDIDGERVRQTAAALLGASGPALGSGTALGSGSEMGGGAAVFAYTCDVTSTSQVEVFARAAAADLGGVDCLVNNAGVLATSRLVDTTDEEWARVLDVNLTGTFRMTRAVLPAMLAAHYGRIVSLASITPLRGEARTTAYAASKGAIVGMTKSLSREVAHRGVTVNAVAPGYMLTEQTEQVFTGEHGDAVRAQITMRDFGSAADVAGAVAYLLSDEARYVTGHVLVVDGGVL